MEQHSTDHLCLAWESVILVPLQVQPSLPASGPWRTFSWQGVAPWQCDSKRIEGCNSRIWEIGGSVESQKIQLLFAPDIRSCLSVWTNTVSYCLSKSVCQCLGNLLVRHLRWTRRSQMAGSLRIGRSEASGGKHPVWDFVVEDFLKGDTENMIDFRQEVPGLGPAR